MGQALEAARREEGFADLVALAWTLQQDPGAYRAVLNWLSEQRARPVHHGVERDTRALTDRLGCADDCIRSVRPAAKARGRVAARHARALYAVLGHRPRRAACAQGRRAARLPRAILTNGNRDMIDVSVRSAGMDGLLDHVGTLLSDVVAVATRRA
jgi:hypothetical protein